MAKRKKGTFVDLQGMDRLQEKVKALAGLMDEKAVEKVMLRAGDVIGDSAKSKASDGPTGNLAKGVVVKPFSRKTKGMPSAFVAIDYKVAPHAHLVEFGTGHKSGDKRRRAKKTVLRFEIDGKVVFAESVGPMPAQPFFRPAIDENKGKAKEVMADGVWHEIEKVAVK